MKKRRYKNVIFSFLTVFASLLFSMLTGELILRLLGHQGIPLGQIRMVYRVDDPILDWRHKPNSEIKIGRVVYKYNNAGFRDVDHPVEKPPGVKRIVVLGDSVTEGYGVEWTSVFSSKIQSVLGGQFEVIQIAAGGLNTPQEVHLFEQEGLQYKADLVIVNFVLNDCDFYANFEGGKRYRAEKDLRIGLFFNIPINPQVKRLLKSSAFIYFMKERLEDLKGRILGRENADYYTRIWSLEENRGKVMSGLDKLASLRSQDNFDVVVMIWPVITDYSRYRFLHIHRWIQKQAEQRGFSTIDLLPKFSRIPFRNLQVTSEDNVHPNALGHGIAADSFLVWLRSHWGAT